MGFAIGDMTFQLLLEARGLLPSLIQAPDVYVVSGGEGERRAALGAVNALRALGVRAEYPFRPPAFGKQFKLAGQSGARLALVFGSDELARGVVKLHDLRDGAESEAPLENLVGAVREALAG